MLYIDKHSKKMRMLLIVKALMYALIVGVLGMFLICQLFFPRKAVDWFGFNWYIVSYTGSMEPMLNYCDLIVIEKFDFDELEIGDTITFSAKIQDSEEEMIITHKIIDVHVVDGRKMYRTQGINTAGADLRPVTIDGAEDTNQYIGKYAFKSTFLGYFISYLKSPSGLITITINFSLVILSYILFFNESSASHL